MSIIRPIRNEPALLLKTREGKVLVVADLHLGFEKKLAFKGINLPTQSTRTLQSLTKMINQVKAEKIVIVGDVKHGVAKILPYEWIDIPRFFEKLVKQVREVLLIPGNHDAGLASLLPSEVKVTSSRGLYLKDDKIYLMHGHTWPNVEAFHSNILIMGHQHLTFELKDDSGLRVAQPIWVSLHWRPDKVAQSYLKHVNHSFTENPKEELEKLYGFKITSPKIIFMPAFNRLIPGTRINRSARTEFMGPMLSGENVDLNSVEITLLDGTYMGKLIEQQVNPY